jgi:hypothetical protein
VSKTARLFWHTPIELKITRTPSIVFCGDIDAVPAKAGMYVFARRDHDRLIPLYVGLARSLRRRLKDHLRSERMITGLRVARGGKRMFVYATFQSADPALAARLLGSFERALIRRALKVGGAPLNTLQKNRLKVAPPERCTLVNEGNTVGLSWWCPRRVTAPLLPPRRGGRLLVNAGP